MPSMDAPVVVDAEFAGGLALVLLVFGYIEFGDRLVAKLSSVGDSGTDLLVDDVD